MARRKLLMISGDSEQRVHIREWRVGQGKNIDLTEEFHKMLDYYHNNGHYVAMGLREFDPTFPPDENLIHVVHITGTFKILTKDGD